MKLFHTLEAFASAHSGIKLLIGRMLILSLFSAVVGSEEGHGVVKTCFKTSTALAYARLELLLTLIENSKQNKEIILAFKGEERKLVQKLYRAPDGISQLLTAEILWRLIMPQRKKHDARVAAASVAFRQISDTHLHTTLVQAFLNIATSKPDLAPSPNSSSKKERQKAGENYFEASLRSFLLKFNQVRPRLSSTNNRPVYSFPSLKVQFGEWKTEQKGAEFWIDLGVFSLTLKLPDCRNSLQHYLIYLPMRKVTDVHQEAASKSLVCVTVQFCFSRHSEEYLETQPIISPEIWDMKVGGELKMVLEMRKDDASNFVHLLDSRRCQDPVISLNSSTASSLSTNGLLPRVATREERSTINAHSARQSLPGLLFQPQAKYGPLSSSPHPQGGKTRKSEAAFGRRNIEPILEASNDDYGTTEIHQDIPRATSKSSKAERPPQVEEDDEELIVKFRTKMAISSPQASKPAPKSPQSPKPIASNRPKEQEGASSSTTHGNSKKTASKASPEPTTTNKRRDRPSKTPSPVSEPSVSRTTPTSETTERDGLSANSSNVIGTPSSPLQNFSYIPIAAEIDLGSGTMVPTVVSIKERPKPIIKPSTALSPSVDDLPANKKKRHRKDMASVAILAQGDPTNADNGAKIGNSQVAPPDDLSEVCSPTKKKSPLPIERTSFNRLPTSMATDEAPPKEMVWAAVLSQSPRKPLFNDAKTTTSKASDHNEATATAEKANRPVALPGPPKVAVAPSRLKSPSSPSLQPIPRSHSGIHLNTTHESTMDQDSPQDDSVDISITHLARRLDFGAEMRASSAPTSSSGTIRTENKGRSQPQTNPPGERLNSKVQKNIDELMRNLENMRLEKVRAAEARREKIRETVTQILASSASQLSQLIDSSTAESLDALNDVAERHRKVLTQFIEAVTSQHSRL